MTTDSKASAPRRYLASCERSSWWRRVWRDTESAPIREKSRGVAASALVHALFTGVHGRLILRRSLPLAKDNQEKSTSGVHEPRRGRMLLN
jgi:hypothetical protein